MTPLQQHAHDIILKLNQADFAGWFTPASVMAFVQVESLFRPRAYRKEPSGVKSYGLMQVLDVTAAELGITDPTTMYDPEIGLRTGMKVARSYWDVLTKHFGRAPTLPEWSASYNEGPGNVFKDRPDLSYVKPWLAARNYWLAQLKIKHQ